MAASTRKNKTAADGSPSKHPEKPAAGIEQDSSDNESTQEDDDQSE
jgi:hypothetical protein